MSYGKVHDIFWEDDRIETLSDRAALLALFLITGPHRNAIGCFKLGLGAITDNQRFQKWGIEGVSKALLELQEIDFIVRDDRTGWTFIRNALKHDPVRGEKTAVHALALTRSVPKNTEVYQRLKDKLEPQLAAQSHKLADKPGWPMEGASHGATHGASDTPSKGDPYPNLTPNHTPKPIATPSAPPSAAPSSGKGTKSKVVASPPASEMPATPPPSRTPDKPPDKPVAKPKAPQPKAPPVPETRLPLALVRPPPRADGRPDWQKALFDHGAPWLAALYDTTTAKLRPLLGRWVKQSGNDPEAVFKLLVEAETRGVTDPRGYVTKALTGKSFSDDMKEFRDINRGVL